MAIKNNKLFVVVIFDQGGAIFSVYLKIKFQNGIQTSSVKTSAYKHKTI